MKKISLQDKLRYQFDNTMSRGPIALIGWLLALSVLLIAVVSFVVVITPIGLKEDGTQYSFFEVAWMSLMRTLDAGTMGGDTGSWPFLFAMFFVTMGGVFIVSTLIGVLTSGIEGKIEELRKGRSFVVEKNHTVILGWSPQIFTIITEVVAANANQKSGCIAILADKDKVEMDDEILARVGNTGHTRIVTRSGNPIDRTDLNMINPYTARSIIILAPEDAEEPDAHVIKTILALTNDPARRPEPYHIVAVIRDPDHMEVARMVSRNEVQLVAASEIISRVTAQTCSQSGLSVVFTELLDFGGDEIYFKSEPSLVGKTFGEALLAYETSAVMGLFKDGKVLLNPPMDTRIEKGDQVIAVSADDDTVVLSGKTDLGVNTDAIIKDGVIHESPEYILMLGWNERAPVIIRELDYYMAKGSHVLVAAPQEAFLKPDFAEELGLTALKHLDVTFKYSETTQRQALEALDLKRFKHGIVLSYSDRMDVQAADAATLVTLLLLRAMSEESGHTITVVSEMLDVRNRDLAQVTRADDFIVSDKLISLMLAQISEKKELVDVFQDLFDPEGSELYMKPASSLVKTGVAMNFYTVVEAARRNGAVALGYRVQAEHADADKAYGIHLNPVKADQITFAPEDRIILLAED